MGAGLEITLILLLVLSNGFFAMAEIAVVSAKKARLHQRAAKGHKGAQVAINLAKSPSDFLSTVQVGVTLAGTLAAALGGATIARQLAAQIQRNAALAPYSDTLGLAVVALSLAYLSLILGELVPKNIALTDPERFAAAIAPAMHRLAKITSPAIRFLSWSTDAVLRLLPVRRPQSTAVIEEEIKVLIEQGTREGTVEEVEQEIIEGAFRLGDSRAIELMTPRVKVVWLSVDDKPAAIAQKVAHSKYARFPVARGSLDELLGFVHVKDLLSRAYLGQPLELQACLLKPLFVPETKRAVEIFELFRNTGTHIAVVVGEHGGVEGILTLTDIIEAVVGDIGSMGESRRPRMTRREDGSWLVDGMLPIAILKEALELGALPQEEHGGFATAAGFAVSHLGRIPSPADHFECQGWRIEVLDMDGNRVDKLLLTKILASHTSIAGEER